MKLAMAMVAMLAVTAPQQLRAPAPRLASIEMETTSWGRLVARWSIAADGTLLYTSVEPGPFDPRQIVTRRYAAGTAGFRQIRVLIGEAETRAGRIMPCDQAIYDAIYGKVRWLQPNGRSKKLAFYTECRQPATRRVVQQLSKANALAKDWAMKGQIVEIKPGKQGGSE
jgi:hypothetical protein